MHRLKDFYGAHPIRRTLLTILLLLALVLFLYFRPAFSLKGAEMPDLKIPHATKGELIPVGGSIVAAKEGGRTLSLNTEELIFTLTDDSSGKTWVSALPGSGEGKDKALLQISFLGNDNVLTEWNSYDNCTAFKTYELYAIENGVRIELDINEGESSEFFEYLPQRIPTERYEEFLMPTLQSLLDNGTLQESDYKKYERALRMVYKKNNAENCYVLTTSGTPSISASAQLIAMTKIVGYTRDMLIEDCAAYGTVPDFHEPAQFDIALEATLDGGDLLVRLPGDEMKSGNDFYSLYRVSVLPSFASEGYSEDTDKYFFVPDGAGALMRLNTYTATVPEYVRPFLDNDYYADYYYMPEYDTELLMPVYGILCGQEKGLMGIVEGGVETANLHASLASASGSGTNRAYVSFDVMDYARVKIYGAYSDNSATYLSSSGHIPADYALRLRPYGKGVTYFDLAMDYRAYLSQKTGKTPAAPEGPKAYLEFLGGVTLADRFLGIPYERTVTMTDYTELYKILENLPEGSCVLQYDGAFNGGVLSGLNNGTEPVKENGSEESRDAVKRLAEEKNLPLFWQINPSRVYTNGRNYVPYFHALRDFSNQAAEIYSYSPATAIFNGRWNPIRAYTRVSPVYLPTLASSIRASSPGTTFALGDLAHDFFLDYRYRSIIHPVQARLLAKEAIQTLADAPLSLKDPAADLAPLADYATDVSRRSSEYTSFYATVPFKQLALSGLVNLAGNNINLSSMNLKDCLLEAAELGTSVKYILTARSPYALKSSHFEYLYAVYYEDWQEDIQQVIEETTRLRELLGGRAIQNHRMLIPGVFETLYDGDILVTVNYTDEPYETEAGTVPAHGCTIGGDSQ